MKIPKAYQGLRANDFDAAALDRDVEQASLLADGELFDSYSQAVMGAVERVGPSVVNIDVRQTVTDGQRSAETGGSGSGFVIARDGFILTNSHVVHGASRIEVTLSDGRNYPAAADRRRPGYRSRGHPHRCSGPHACGAGGIFRGAGGPDGHRDRQSPRLPGQRDRWRGERAWAVAARAIRPHDRKCDSNGRGIEPRKFRRSARGFAWRGDRREHGDHPARQGICFATAIDTAKFVAGWLIKEGRFRRASIGVGGQDVPLHRRVVLFHKLSVESGVLVVSVEKNSPAQEAKLEVGDVIVGFNEHPVASIADLHKLLLGREIGVRSELTVSRHTELLRLPITPREAISTPAEPVAR